MNTTLNPKIEIPWPDIVPVTRRLGSGVEPIRRLYFLDFPLLLFSVGLIPWMFPTDTMLFIAVLTGALVGLYTLWEIAIRRKPIRFSHFFGIANTVGCGLGVVNSWLTVSRGSQTLAQFFNRDPEAASLNSGDFGLSGALLGWVFPTLFALTWLSFLEWQTAMLKAFFAAMLAIQFILVVPTGRRNLVNFVLLAIIAARFGSFRVKWSFMRRLVSVVILAPLVALGATSFYYLRYASWGKHKISLTDQIFLALELFESGNTAKANQSLKENLAERTFILGYVSDLLDASLRMDPARGQNTLHEFQLTIPSALWADKSAFLYSEESIANTTYHFAYKDEANSLYSAGAIDFGIWGMILYPIIIATLFRVVAEVVRIHFPELVATLVILYLLYIALITEASLWVSFQGLRDPLIYATFLWVIFSIPAFALTHQPKNRFSS